MLVHRWAEGICRARHLLVPGRRNIFRRAAITALAFFGLFKPSLAGGADVASSGPLSVLSVFDNFLILAILGGTALFALGAGVIFLRAAANSGRQARQTAEKIAHLQLANENLETVLWADPQILVEWDSREKPKLLIDTVGAELGLPRTLDSLLAFEDWLETRSAVRLREDLALLMAEGRPFNRTLSCHGAQTLEADGRVAGGKALLKLRDQVGEKLDRARFELEQDRLERQISATRSLLDALPMPVWFRNDKNQLGWVNDAYVQAVGADGRDEVQQHQIEFLEERQRDMIASRHAQDKAFRERLHVVVGGERQAFEAIVLPLGERSAGVAVDVAAEDRIQAELDRYKAAHGRTLDRVVTAVAIFGPEQRLIFFNQAYHDLWKFDLNWLTSGPKDGEILDRLRAKRMLPEQANYPAWKSKRLELYEREGAGEDWWHLPDGQAVHVMWDATPDGGVTYLFENVTERLELESRYTALFNVQRETLDALHEGVAVFTPDGRLKLFNRAFARIWKLNVRALDEQPHIDEVIANCRILFDDETVWSRIKSAATAFDEKRRPVTSQMRRPDDSVIASVCSPLPDGAMLLTFVDISDAERVKQALIERSTALEAADKLKTDFVSHISYELRTPLTNIIGFAELLANPGMGELNDRQQDYLADIRQSSETLQSLINDILDLATIDAGRLDLQLGPVLIGDVIRNAELGVRERLKQAGITLELDIKDPEIEFVADGRRVTQILYNLLSNAIGFSNAGDSIRLTAWREPGRIAFDIVDRGNGIPAEYQNVVFNRFESHSRGSTHRGAGLGLSIVKNLVELHGGEVILRSSENEGTKVTVLFPQRPQRKVA